MSELTKSIYFWFFLPPHFERVHNINTRTYDVKAEFSLLFHFQLPDAILFIQSYEISIIV